MTSIEYTDKYCITPASDSRARRAAKRVGLIARRGRGWKGTDFNHGGYQLLDLHNWIVAGVHCELTADQVIAFCKKRP
jgi:hypothetical protein